VNELLKAMGGAGGEGITRTMSHFGFNGDRAAAARYRAAQNINWPVVDENDNSPTSNWQR